MTAALCLGTPQCEIQPAASPVGEKHRDLSAVKTWGDGKGRRYNRGVHHASGNKSPALLHLQKARCRCPCPPHTAALGRPAGSVEVDLKPTVTPERYLGGRVRYGTCECHPRNPDLGGW